MGDGFIAQPCLYSRQFATVEIAFAVRNGYALPSPREKISRSAANFVC